MATKDKDSSPPPPPPSSGPEPLTPAKQRRMEKCLEHANRLTAKKDHDYATELLTQCVAGDPRNLVYLESFLDNLQAKYKNNKKGSKLAGFKGGKFRNAAKKAVAAKDWEGTFQNGLEMLKLNPWDFPTLAALSEACELITADECELRYLRMALEAKPKDPDVNRSCAKSLGRQRHYDQAIACWHRVELALPDNEEAEEAIAELSIRKAREHGRYDEGGNINIAKQQDGPRVEADQQVFSPVQRLEREITRHPEAMENYIELSELHIREERFEEAADVLQRAHEVSDGNEEIRERWEEVELRRIRQQVGKADKRARQGDEDAAKESRELTATLNVKELALYKVRCERYPNNLSYKFELGRRHQFARQYNEAIEQYQKAVNDPRRKGLCMLNLGICFQQIKQYRLGLSHYDSATRDIPDRDPDNKQRALYLAGKLAMNLKNLRLAEKYLTALAALNFGYRDISDLLDKLDDMRNDVSEDEPNDAGDVSEDDDQDKDDAE
ncbi:MAG: hypothetical protein HQ581_25060 [Planctomycetes bacterium]|nr:hypothetical protein [Planctomycetota bacterium]